jgi:Ca2+-binding RTX toxin-like protein
VSSHISLIIIFYLNAIVVTSSLLLSSVDALSPLTAKARSSANMLVSSNTDVRTNQLPLPTNAMQPGIRSQVTGGQDDNNVAISSSRFGSSNSVTTNINNLGDRIEGLSLSPGSRTSGNVITCRPLIPCIGTNNTDFIMAGISEQIFALKGDDIIFSAADDQLYGDGGNDIILAGAGNSLADGGPGDDVLTGGIGHSLLVGGPGNDKLFAGPGDTVISGGSGANHFDCPASISGLARSIVLDYNPANGDTISGQCTLVNNVGPSGGSGGRTASQITLPDTGETSSDSSLGTQGVIASRGAGG